MSPEVHNRGISSPAKRTYVLQKDVLGVSLPEVIGSFVSKEEFFFDIHISLCSEPLIEH